MDELEARIPHPLGDNLCDPPHDQEPHAIVPLDQPHEPLAINREDGGVLDTPCSGGKAEGGDQGRPAERFGKMGDGEHTDVFTAPDSDVYRDPAAFKDIEVVSKGILNKY